MNLQTMRNVVVNNMPYDTGFMFSNGAKFYDTNHYLLVKYDTERVPYIIYNEEGTIYTTKNQYFIRRDTVNDLMRFESYQQNGLQAPMNKYNRAVKRKAFQISQGAIEKMR